MEPSIGTVEVDAVTRLAEEAADMHSDALHALMSVAGVELLGNALPPSENLPEHITPPALMALLVELQWPKRERMRADLVQCLVSRTSDDSLFEYESPEFLVVPMARAVLLIIIASASTYEEALILIFWLMDQRADEAVSVARVMELLPDVAAVAAAAGVVTFLNDSQTPRNRQAGIIPMFDARRDKAIQILGSITWPAMDKIGLFSSRRTTAIDCISVDDCIRLGEHMAEELLDRVADALDNTDVAGENMEMTGGSTRSSDSGSLKATPRTTSRFKLGTWRLKSGAPEPGNLDTSMTSRGRSMLGLIRGRQKRQSDYYDGTFPSRQHSSADNVQPGVSLPASNAQQKPARRVRISIANSPEKEKASKVPERPSLIAAQKAALAAEAAAAAELKPPSEPDKKANLTASLVEALVALCVSVATRIFLLDAARMLMLTALVLTDAAIVTSLILRWSIPVPWALGIVVLINFLLAGVAMLLVWTGISCNCCCSCCRPKKNIDANSSFFSKLDVRPTLQKYVDTIQRSAFGSSSASVGKELADIDEEAHHPDPFTPSTPNSPQGMARGAPTHAASRSPGFSPMTLHGHAQNLWSLIGRVAGFTNPPTRASHLRSPRSDSLESSEGGIYTSGPHQPSNHPFSTYKPGMIGGGV